VAERLASIVSTFEHEHAVEQRSSVKVAMTAKGEATVEVKVYVNEDNLALEAARKLAIRTYLETAREVRGTPKED
jgi:predicted solute-binding protein